MRKVVFGMLLLTCVYFVGQNFSLERVRANEQVSSAVEWVNTLGRKPEDPAYLTLNYRLRRLYFSLTAG